MNISFNDCILQKFSSYIPDKLFLIYLLYYRFYDLANTALTIFMIQKIVKDSKHVCSIRVNQSLHNTQKYSSVKIQKSIAPDLTKETKWQFCRLLIIMKLLVISLTKTLIAKKNFISKCVRKYFKSFDCEIVTKLLPK